MRYRTFGVLAVLASCTLVGGLSAREDKKKPTDDEIKKLIVGKWAIDETEMGLKIKGTQTYTKDGKLEAEVTVEMGKDSLKLVVSGTWTVKDGAVIETVTKSNHPEIIKEGMESTDKVLSIDDKEYKFKDEQGKERSVKRVKQ